MMELLVNLIRTLCLFLLTQSAFGMMASAGKCFEMSPNSDIFLQVGNVLQLNCTLKLPNNSTDCFSDPFILNKTKIMKGSEELGQDFFQYHVTENTVQMTFENVSLEDSGTYVCKYGDSQIIQALRRVHIGEAPGVPENLVCISRNHEDLACSFSLSKQSNIPLTWKMEYKHLLFNTRQTVNCSKDLNSGSITCGKISEEHFGHNFKYDITVEGGNVSYRVNITKTFKIKVNESIVRPNPVVGLHDTINSTNGVVKVNWMGPDGLTADGKVIFNMDYKIRITSKWNNFTKMIRNASEKSKEYSLTDLTPYTNYTVTVVVKPTAAIGEIYWSDPSTIHFITPRTVPDRSVSMTTGSYTWLNCDEQAVCSVMIYWKNPPEMFWNGPIFGYEITVEEIDVQASLAARERTTFIDRPEYRLKRLTKPTMKNITGLSVSALILNLRKVEDYKLEVTLKNSEGMSRESSELKIQHWNQAQKLKVELVSVEVGDTSVDISWVVSPQICANITSVTIYWCLVDAEKTSNASGSLVHCKDLFDWSTFIKTGCENKTSHRIQQLHDYSNLKYAVSLETNKISGGLVWENFRFKKEAVPEMPLYKVDSNGNKLVIEILYGQYFDSEGGQPEQYIVSYSVCTENNCSTDEKIESFAANFTTPVYKTEKLKAGSRYRVYVTASNRYGNSGRGEPVIKAILKVDDSLESSKIALKVIAAVIGCLAAFVIVLVICFCWRKRHKQMQADLDITVLEPDMKESYMMKNGDSDIYKNADNHDSGKGSDSPGSSVGQIDSVLKGMTEFEGSPCIVSGSSVVGNDSDRQHLVHTNQKSSPVLSGYRKNVSDVTSTDHGIAENSEDEIDDDSQNTDSLKKMLEVNEKVPKQGVPFEKLDSDKVRQSLAKEKIENERDDSVLQNVGQDYSVATTLHETNEQRFNHCKLSAGGSNSKDMREFSISEESDLNMEETKIVEDIDLKLLPSSHTGSANKPEAVDLSQGGMDSGRVLDSFVSSGVDFEDFCNDLNDSSNPYKDPDQVSLGDGSTISDVSELSITDFEDIKNLDEGFDIIEEKGKTESEKDVNDACSNIEDTSKQVTKNSEKLDEKASKIKKEDKKVNQGDQVSGGVIRVGKDLYSVSNSGKDVQEENIIQDGKNDNEPASLEPYIMAGLGSNGFVKSSKPKRDDNTSDLKTHAILKHSFAEKDLSMNTNSETSN